MIGSRHSKRSTSVPASTNRSLIVLAPRVLLTLWAATAIATAVAGHAHLAPSSVEQAATASTVPTGPTEDAASPASGSASNCAPTLPAPQTGPSTADVAAGLIRSVTPAIIALAVLALVTATTFSHRPEPAIRLTSLGRLLVDLATAIRGKTPLRQRRTHSRE
jgi:hypothetical protein